MLQRGDEGQLHALPRQHASLRAQLRRPGHQPVGVRLQPRDLGQRRAVRAQVGGQFATPPPLDERQRPVRRDLVQPRTDRPAVLEPAQAPPGPIERVLNHVVGIVNRPQHPVAVRPQLLAQRPYQPSERLAVTRTRRARPPAPPPHPPPPAARPPPRPPPAPRPAAPPLWPHRPTPPQTPPPPPEPPSKAPFPAGSVEAGPLLGRELEVDGGEALL